MSALILSWMFIVPEIACADDAHDLFDKTIRWHDGTEERVQIGTDGFFRLDGRAVRLVGIDIGTTGFAQPYYEPASLAIIEKELAYLESIGVRVIHANIGYAGHRREAQCYKPLLDLLRKHKMLVLPLISGKWLPNFGDLTNPDFKIGGSDSLLQWADRWCKVMADYPNVVAIAVENELDIPLKPPAVPAPQAYTAATASAYMKLLTTKVRTELQVPVVTKIVGEVNASWPWRPDIKEAVLPFSDVPCLDVYYPTLTELNSHLDATLAWLKEKGFKTSGFWIGETSGGTGNSPRSADFTPAYLESMFDRGAAVVCLWVANRVKEPNAAFFDAEGNSTESLQKIAPQLVRLQARE